MAVLVVAGITDWQHYVHQFQGVYQHLLNIHIENLLAGHVSEHMPGTCC